jgi:transcriptional regulator with XRE-family HTH domain
MDIGAQLREVRDKAALTQIELARRAGVSQATISAVERGYRQPSIDVVTRILAAVELQPHFTAVPATSTDAELDAELDAVLRRPPAERLIGRWFNGPALLRTLAPVEPVVEGAAGAALHGAPVPVAFLEVAIERSRLLVLEEVVRRSFAERWSEVWNQWGMESPDPRARGPLRWQTSDGEFRVRWIDERPETVTVLVADAPTAVLTLHDIEANDPRTRHVLSRIRRRSPQPAPPGPSGTGYPEAGHAEAGHAGEGHTGAGRAGAPHPSGGGLR